MRARRGPARWRELDGQTRALLEGRLAGLYGAAGDEHAFDALPADKRGALLLFARRLAALKLWRGVVKVFNVYGAGGVGMDFEGRPRLVAALNLRRDFTPFLAAHRPRWRGFRERGTRRAALHFLYEGAGEKRRWSVHFDLDNPLASPARALRHLYREVWRGTTPDWQLIEDALAARGDRRAAHAVGALAEGRKRL